MSDWVELALDLGEEVRILLKFSQFLENFFLRNAKKIKFGDSTAVQK